jgi:hypothetical protein
MNESYLIQLIRAIYVNEDISIEPDASNRAHPRWTWAEIGPLDGLRSIIRPVMKRAYRVSVMLRW